MTPNSVLQTVREQFTETTAAFLQDNEIYRWMSQAEEHIAATYNCIQTTAIATSVTAQQAYTAPTGILSLTRVQYDGVKLKRMMDIRDQDGLDFNSYGRTLRTGQPTHYYEYGEEINLYPLPPEAKEIKYWYNQNAVEVTNQSTSFSVPKHFHVHLPDYCLYRAYLKDQDDGRAMTHKNLWDEGIKDSYMKWRQRSQQDGYYVVKEEANYPSTELGII